MVIAVEQVFVARRIDADHCNRRAVAAFLSATGRVGEDIDVQGRRPHISETQPLLLEQGLRSGRRVLQHLRRQDS